MDLGRDKASKVADEYIKKIRDAMGLNYWNVQGSTKEFWRAYRSPVIFYKEGRVRRIWHPNI